MEQIANKTDSVRSSMALAGQYMAMSEDEWNKIVLKNLQAHKDEETQRK